MMYCYEKHNLSMCRGGDVTLLLDPVSLLNMCAFVNNDSANNMYLLGRSSLQIDPQYGGADFFITEVSMNRHATLSVCVRYIIMIL